MRRLTLLALAGALICLGGCLSITKMDVSPVETPREIPLSDFTYILSEDPFPFIGSFRRMNDSLIGGGSLIQPTIVLTAGHVVDETDVDYFSIGGKKHQIDRVILHEDYKPYGYDLILYDIALVFLCEPSEVMPVELADKDDYIFKGMSLTTVGFGRGFKRYSNPGVFWYYGRLMAEPWKVQMLPTESSIWFGDSGGAVLSQGKLIAVMSSFSMRKGIIYENSSTSVAYFKSWIEEVTDEQAMERMVGQ